MLGRRVKITWNIVVIMAAPMTPQQLQQLQMNADMAGGQQIPAVPMMYGAMPQASASESYQQTLTEAEHRFQAAKNRLLSLIRTSMDTVNEATTNSGDAPSSTNEGDQPAAHDNADHTSTHESKDGTEGDDTRARAAAGGRVVDVTKFALSLPLLQPVKPQRRPQPHRSGHHKGSSTARAEDAHPQGSPRSGVAAGAGAGKGSTTRSGSRLAESLQFGRPESGRNTTDGHSSAAAAEQLSHPGALPSPSSSADYSGHGLGATARHDDASLSSGGAAGAGGIAMTGTARRHSRMSVGGASDRDGADTVANNNAERGAAASVNSLKVDLKPHLQKARELGIGASDTSRGKQRDFDLRLGPAYETEMQRMRAKQAADFRKQRAEAHDRLAMLAVAMGSGGGGGAGGSGHAVANMLKATSNGGVGFNATGAVPGQPVVGHSGRLTVTLPARSHSSMGLVSTSGSSNATGNSNSNSHSNVGIGIDKSNSTMIGSGGSGTTAPASPTRDKQQFTSSGSSAATSGSMVLLSPLSLQMQQLKQQHAALVTSRSSRHSTARSGAGSASAGAAAAGAGSRASGRSSRLGNVHNVSKSVGGQPAADSNSHGAAAATAASSSSSTSPPLSPGQPLLPQLNLHPALISGHGYPINNAGSGSVTGVGGAAYGPGMGVGMHYGSSADSGPGSGGLPFTLLTPGLSPGAVGPGGVIWPSMGINTNGSPTPATALLSASSSATTPLSTSMATPGMHPNPHATHAHMPFRHPESGQWIDPYTGQPVPHAMQMALQQQQQALHNHQLLGHHQLHNQQQQHLAASAITNGGSGLAGNGLFPSQPLQSQTPAGVVSTAQLLQGMAGAAAAAPPRAGTALARLRTESDATPPLQHPALFAPQPQQQQQQQQPYRSYSSLHPVVSPASTLLQQPTDALPSSSSSSSTSMSSRAGMSATLASASSSSGAPGDTSSASASASTPMESSQYSPVAVEAAPHAVLATPLQKQRAARAGSGSAADTRTPALEAAAAGAGGSSVSRSGRRGNRGSRSSVKKLQQETQGGGTDSHGAYVPQDSPGSGSELNHSDLDMLDDDDDDDGDAEIEGGASAGGNDNDVTGTALDLSSSGGPIDQGLLLSNGPRESEFDSIINTERINHAGYNDGGNGSSSLEDASHGAGNGDGEGAQHQEPQALAAGGTTQHVDGPSGPSHDELEQALQRMELMQQGDEAGDHDNDRDGDAATDASDGKAEAGDDDGASDHDDDDDDAQPGSSSTEAADLRLELQAEAVAALMWQSNGLANIDVHEGHANADGNEPGTEAAAADGTAAGGGGARPGSMSGSHTSSLRSPATEREFIRILGSARGATPVMTDEDAAAASSSGDADIDGGV